VRGRHSHEAFAAGNLRTGGRAALCDGGARGIAIKYLDSKVDAANERAAQAEGARAKEEQSRKGFQTAAEACSESVTKLQAAAKERDALYAKGLAGSRAKTTAAEAQIAALLSERRPAGMSECDAMKKELDDEIDRRAARP